MTNSHYSYNSQLIASINPISPLNKKIITMKLSMTQSDTQRENFNLCKDFV